MQCGLALLEALADGTYAPARCLNSLAAPYTRLAVDDLTQDGVADVVATSFAEGAVALVRLSDPQEYSDAHGSPTFQVALNDGQEACTIFYDIEGFDGMLMLVDAKAKVEKARAKQERRARGGFFSGLFGRKSWRVEIVNEPSEWGLWTRPAKSLKHKEHQEHEVQVRRSQPA